MVMILNMMCTFHQLLTELLSCEMFYVRLFNFPVL